MARSTPGVVTDVPFQTFSLTPFKTDVIFGRIKKEWIAGRFSELQVEWQPAPY